MSLLTGVHPWSHRGFIHGPRIASPFDTENIFTLFDDYHTMAYTHNYVAEDVLRILQGGLDQLIPKPTLYTHKSFFLHDILGDDFDIATLSKQRILNNENEGYASSLFLTHLVEWINSFRERELRENFLVPPKVSGSEDLFLLEEATDWIVKQAMDLPRPYLSYIHLFPPHEPYIVRKDFADTFQDDGFVPVRKPTHFFTEIKFSSYEETDDLRLAYNQALRYVDIEFGRVMAELKKAGQLENTIVIFTSDHGEIFERGLTEHIRPVFYQPMIQIPLLIFLPDQKERVDVFETTSAIDIIPTLLHLSGRSIPGLLEGIILPPFNDPDPFRPVFAMDARKNPKEEKLSLYTAMMRKGPYKFTQYYGYDQLPDGKPFFELFNLEEDPEELVNLAGKEEDILKEMRAELDQEISEKDQPLKVIS
jgi:arylsulfatase A-like enzyme